MCTILSEVLLEMQKLAGAAAAAPAKPEEEKKDEEQPAEAMEGEAPAE